jgi:hypothetical protein
MFRMFVIHHSGGAVGLITSGATQKNGKTSSNTSGTRDSAKNETAGCLERQPAAQSVL